MSWPQLKSGNSRGVLKLEMILEIAVPPVAPISAQTAAELGTVTTVPSMKTKPQSKQHSSEGFSQVFVPNCIMQNG